jgi:hypothetical protein
VFLLNDVGSQILADDVVWASSGLRGQDTAGVGAKDRLEGSEHIVLRNAGLVVVDCLPSNDILFVSAVLFWGC